MRGRKQQAILYFFLYLLAGPLLGFVAAVLVLIVAGYFGTGMVIMGRDIMGWLKSGYLFFDLFALSRVAYVFGGFQAGITGYFTTRDYFKLGRSNLLKSVLISLACNGGLVLLIVLAFGYDAALIGLGIVLVVAGIFSVFVLYWMERFFLVPTEQ